MRGKVAIQAVGLDVAFARYPPVFPRHPTSGCFRRSASRSMLRLTLRYGRHPVGPDQLVRPSAYRLLPAGPASERSVGSPPRYGNPLDGTAAKWPLHSAPA